MYVPSFLEIFLAFAALTLWSTWARRDHPAARVVRALPWVVGVVVVGAQLVAGYVLLTAATGGPAVFATVEVVRSVSALVVLGGGVLALGLTVVKLRRR